MPRYIDADELYKATQKRIAVANEARIAVVDDEFLDLIDDAFTEDVAPRVEVAEEIFSEIRKCWARRLFDCDDFTCKDFAFEDFAGDLDELYKKYMGDQT